MGFLQPVRDLLQLMATPAPGRLPWLVAGTAVLAGIAGWAHHRRVLRRVVERGGLTEAAASDGRDLLNLLYSIAQDQATEEGFVHRRISCNACHASPIRGTRYKCANCVDYDVCSLCEPMDNHNNTHVFLKIVVPLPPLINPRAPLLQPFYPGLPTNRGALERPMLRQLEAKTHFDHRELEALHEQFKTLAVKTEPSGTLGISRAVFQRCLGPLGRQRNLVVDRMFLFYDQDGDDVISFTDLALGMSILCKGTQEEKVEYAFAGYDLHRLGFITKDDLRALFGAYFALSMEIVRDLVNALEEEMLSGFNDEDTKPVSAAFTAPIPNDNGVEEKDESVDLFGLGGTASDRGGTLARDQQRLAALMDRMSSDAIHELVESAFDKADLDRDGRLTFAEFKAWAATDHTLLVWFDCLGSVF